MCFRRAALIEVIVAIWACCYIGYGKPIHTYIHTSFNTPRLARELFYLLRVAQTKMSFGLLLTDSLPQKTPRLQSRD
ncbi:hypothetical protein BDV09DRAFT_166659 [Aspergillus tetrazonus]